MDRRCGYAAFLRYPSKVEQGRENNTSLSMDYPSDEDVFDLIEDYHTDFGTTLPFEDAHRLLVLYEEMRELFEKHLAEEERGGQTALLDQE
jgi:hypothetical protein